MKSFCVEFRAPGVEFGSGVSGRGITFLYKEAQA
jgi:hypothetical protein